MRWGWYRRTRFARSSAAGGSGCAATAKARTVPASLDRMRLIRSVRAFAVARATAAARQRRRFASSLTSPPLIRHQNLGALQKLAGDGLELRRQPSVGRAERQAGDALRLEMEIEELGRNPAISFLQQLLEPALRIDERAFERVNRLLIPHDRYQPFEPVDPLTQFVDLFVFHHSLIAARWPICCSTATDSLPMRLASSSDHKVSGHRAPVQRGSCSRVARGDDR